MVALEVADTGVGIPAENLPHIFDRFYRVRAPDQPDHGSWFGVELRLLDREGARRRMEVASTVGEGTCFRIQLPREGEESQVAPRLLSHPLHWIFLMSLEVTETIREGILILA